MTASVIVHITEDGGYSYLVSGDVRVFVVDERAPSDRVYELTDRCDEDEIVTLLRDDPVGSKNDSRHAAIEAKILAHVKGRPHLEVVK